mmetsp:Transcript_29057/g.66544  ORF Transcript_29057/g.66544 Transcript_29057/m.66544 type:complete len:282 (-) Transcript_29057:1707-2552(-)
MDKDRVEGYAYIADLLQKRCSAAESCKFALCLIMTTKSISRLSSPNSEDFLGNYSNIAVDVIPLLSELSLRLAGVRAAGAKHIIKNVIEVGKKWGQVSLGEEPNSYVDDLTNRCISIWQLMSTAPGKYAVEVVDIAWANLIDGAYHILLEAFSKIIQCSTEGRALMSMDHAAFVSSILPKCVMDEIIKRVSSSSELRIENHSVDQYVSASRVVPRMGRQYVDQYISAFYFDEQDVIKWIAVNQGEYRLRHAVSLIICGIGARTRRQRVQQIVGQIEAMYKK